MKQLDSISVRTFDTKRTIFVRDGNIEVVHDSALDIEKQNNGDPIWKVDGADASGKRSIVKPTQANNNAIYKWHEEKQHTDYTEKIIKIAQQMEGKGRKLIGVHNATSYGYVNQNDRLYHVDSIVENATTFYTPNPVPFMYDHSDHEAKKTIGRIFHAQPVYFRLPQNKMNDLRIPKAYIKVYSIITDQDAIEGILDNRYLTISSSFRPNFDTLECSICGKNPFVRHEDDEEDCTHDMGSDYDGQKAFLIIHDMRYKESSYVSSPADLFSKNISWELLEGEALINGDSLNRNLLKDMQDNHQIEAMADGLGCDSDIQLYLVDSKSPKKIIDLYDMEEKKFTDILGNDWKCDGDVCELIHDNQNQTSLEPINRAKNIINEEEENEANESENEAENEDNNDNIKVTNNSNETPCTENKEIDESDEDSEEDMKNIVAALDCVQPLLEDETISIEDAIEYLKESGAVVLYSTSTLPTSKELSDNIINILNEYFKDESESETEEDAKLKTAARKRLPKSSFCGPNRSFPVNDCAHVTAARRLIGRYKGPGSKSTILACVNRKAKALGCDKPNKTK